MRDRNNDILAVGRNSRTSKRDQRGDEEKSSRMSEIRHWKSGIGGQAMKLINANRLKDAITKTRMNCQKHRGRIIKKE